jgi:hypothetical protein
MKGISIRNHVVRGNINVTLRLDSMTLDHVRLGQRHFV